MTTPNGDSLKPKPKPKPRLKSKPEPELDNPTTAEDEPSGGTLAASDELEAALREELDW